MNKLFELTTLCLNSKELYTNNKISYVPLNKILPFKYGYYKLILDLKEDDVKPERHYPMSNVSTDWHWILSEFRDKYGKDEYFPEIKNLKIEFNDKPPIYLVGYSNNNKSEKLNGFVNIEYMGLFKKRERRYNFDYQKFTFEMNYEIRCGSIIEKITAEDFSKFLSIYTENTIQFKKEEDMLKIEERLKLFKK